MTGLRRWRLCAPLVAMIALGGAPPTMAAGENAADLEIALDLARMLQSARSVIAENQKLINDASIGDKGLSGDIVLARALEKFRKAKGPKPKDIRLSSRHGRLLKAQMDAITTVMRDNQSTINQPGMGFKGFVPAVFARLVNEEFRRTSGSEAEIKVTAPPEKVRNRKARPDAWETEIIQGRFMAADWPKGRVLSAEASNRGRKAFRVLVPEYYGQGCMACHGGPKGELDITGYPKEGGKVGELGGVISVTLYRR